MLQVGSKSIEFSLFDTNKNLRSLSEFKGKNIVLAFYPGAFTSVCTKELCSFRDSISNFSKLNAHVIAISVDSPFANKAFADQNNLNFPVLSDYTREVSKQYGGVHEDFVGMKGYSVSKRAVFIIDTNGIVKYAWVTENPGVEPDYEEITRILK